MNGGLKSCKIYMNKEIRGEQVRVIAMDTKVMALSFRISWECFDFKAFQLYGNS